MTLLGWKDSAMARRYGKASAGARARDALNEAWIED